MNIYDAHKMARQQMDENGLTDWSFKFDNAVRRFGQCSYRTKTISMSRVLTELNNPLDVFDTIAHEIAHALVGRGNGHNRVWQHKAIELGCNGRATYSGATIAQPKPKFKSTCPNCGKTSTGNARRNVACRMCCTKYNRGRYTIEYKLMWGRN